ncbi:hypothetical protein BDZ94DRAFT_1266623 [Collybia nuda]|uniref:DUF6699 domain-containing protein n=1 Tax=Collybia nuda TaxID=64659 RepID=A0A9P5XYN1_9AGAR|nr:hypothetical protein BDZ94DRAFT_1266623 [Collybia nuda]
MSGRYVHFAYDSYPPTPPSTFSNSSSLPSPGGPMTPPPLHYKHAPLPAVPCQLNPILAAPSAHNLHYNMTLPPSTVQFHPTVPHHIRDEPATYPHVPRMTITSRSLPWSITVTPSGKSVFVTVSDVFKAIYASLRVNMTSGEFAQLRSVDAQRQVNDAYRRRYRLIPNPSAYDEEKRQGLRRVDFLAAMHCFAGLSPTKQGPDVWELSVS